jgi:hypothetical protein
MKYTPIEIAAMLQDNQETIEDAIKAMYDEQDDHYTGF